MGHKCQGCGVCCKLFLINLTEKEYKSGDYKTQFEKFGVIEDFAKAEDCGANIIEQKAEDDMSCIYLKDKKCSIHETRPESCKVFFCDSEEEQFQGMINDLKKAKK
jgi:Fe-S-cluster containining protein